MANLTLSPLDALDALADRTRSASRGPRSRDSLHERGAG
jgi:hypothetical protein